MRLLQAGHLAAQRQIGRRTSGSAERRQTVAVVDRVSRRERVAVADGVVARACVPKSSRMVCRGLLYESAVPLGRPFDSSSGPLASGHRATCTSASPDSDWHRRVDAGGIRQSPWRACASGTTLTLLTASACRKPS